MNDGMDGFTYYRLASIFIEIQINKYLFERPACAGPRADCNMEGKDGQNRDPVLRKPRPCQCSMPKM